jgi:ABC-type Fe3+ transport system substrate-binding protein
MMKQMLRVTLIAGVVLTMALGIAVEFATADTLKSLVAGAKNEKNLKVTLHFIKQEHVKKLEAAFNARYGLDITLEANLSGKYTSKAKKVIKQVSEGASPTFDVMVLSEPSYSMMADAGALEKIDGWKNLLPEGSDPSVSPGPIAGLGFIVWDFYFGYSYRADKVDASIFPLSMKDLAKSSLKGNAVVSMYMSNITYAVLKYSPEEVLSIFETWNQNGVEKYHPRKMAIEVSKGTFSLAGFHTTDQYLNAGSTNGHYKMGLFKDIVPRGVLLHVVPKGVQSPNAAKLFAIWMTGKEAVDICGEGTLLGNILKNGNQKAIALAEQQMMKENLKPVSFFDSEESYKKLVWLGTAEGQQFVKSLAKSLKKSHKK